MTKRKQIFSAIGILAILGALALFTLPLNVQSTTTTPALYGTNVPTADSTANNVSADVIGNKTDAAATGAVSETESLMAYAKQNVTAAITNDSNIDAILVDTGTTIPGTITTMQNDLDIITGATGVNLLTATQASIDAIETDTSTTIPGTITTMQNDLDIITGATGVNLLTATQASIDAIETDTSTTIPGTITTVQNDLDIITGATGVNLLTATQASIDAIEADTAAMDTNTEINVLWAHPRCVAKSDGAVLNGDDALFTISGGPVRAKIVGYVTTVLVGASDIRLQMDVTEPAGTVELNAGAVTIDADAAGTLYYNVGATSVFTPVTAGAVILDPVTVEEAEFILPPGTVMALSTAAQTGVIAWYMTYTPLSPDSVVVAAP